MDDFALCVVFGFHVFLQEFPHSCVGGGFLGFMTSFFYPIIYMLSMESVDFRFSFGKDGFYS